MTLAHRVLPDMDDLQSSLNFSDNINLSTLIPYQRSDTEWLTQDPFNVRSWDFVVADQTLNPFAESAGLAEIETRSSYTTGNHGAPAGWGGYTIKTHDTLSDAFISIIIFSAWYPEKETWSPSHSKHNKSGGLSPIDAIDVTTRASSQKSENTTNINPRKASNAFTSFLTPSRYSTFTLPRSTVSSSRTSNHKSARLTLAQDTNTAAVMKQKKAAHNIIEKRYRTNMNIKFQALGNAIPRGFTGTQPACKKGSRRCSSCQPSSRSDNASGPGRRQKEEQQQNKSEILTNALYYIHELKDQNSRLKRELLVLKENLLPRGNIMCRQER